MYTGKPFSIYHALQEYAGRDFISFHMPGHKQNALFANELPWQMDITEIPGFDSLHHASGIIKSAENRAASLWDSRESFFLVNGATAGILAGIYAATNAGEKILLARNCHKSVYHAVELLNLQPIFLDPPQVKGTGVLGSISPNQVAHALSIHEDIALCVLVSPTYEGIISDIAAISALLSAKNIPLFVDEAHGAHFGLSKYFPESAITQGADLVVQSLHKTLPSLTQTAVLHTNSPRISDDKLRHALGIFQTSSPSYPLMASMDSCIQFLAGESDSYFERFYNHLQDFYAKSETLKHLHLLSKSQDPVHIFAEDPSKLTILCQGASIDGHNLAETLRTQYGIQLEMALSTHALAMSSIANTKEQFDKLFCALKQIDTKLSSVQGLTFSPLPPLGAQKMSIAIAQRAKYCLIPLSESIGKVSASYVWAMPPCVPILIPGTEITEEIIAYLRQLDQNSILQDKKIAAGYIACVDK